MPDQVEGDSVSISTSYAKVLDYSHSQLVFTDWLQVRRQGRKGFTEIIQKGNKYGIEKTFETDVETKKIISIIEEINKNMTKQKISAERHSGDQTETSSNIFQNLWETILG